MKIVFICTNHEKREEAIVITLECNGEDTWTFTGEGISFSISDLSLAMDFLASEFDRK